MNLLEQDRFAREAACPACGASLHMDNGTPWCPMCAWNALADDARPVNAVTGTLFAVDGHDVLAEIGRGGGGIVYHAHQHEPAREVALKILPPHQIASPEMRARFRAEAETIAALDHPVILPVFAVGEHQDMPYFTMKLVRGGTLTLRREALHGRWTDIAQLVTTLADAIAFAHARGVIHRDLKPGNVLFDEFDRPYVSDFGTAKFLDASGAVTRTLAMLGTPAYLAPEVAQGGAGSATILSDVYGLGTILYELLTGRPPFAAAALPALMRDVIERPPVEPRRVAPSVPRDLEIICLRCLAKKPDQRFATAAALAEDLQRWLDGKPIASRSATTAERVARWVRRHPSTAAFSAALVATLVTAALVLIDQNVDLRRTLARATSAERLAQEQLHASLVNEARLLRQTARAGERGSALAALERAAAIRATPELRTELVTTLAQADLVTERVMPVTLPARNGTIAFKSDFSSFLVADSKVGFLQRETGSGNVLRHYRSGRNQPSLYLWYACADRSIVATYLDRSSEVWDADADAPWWTMEGEAVPSITHGGHTRREPVIALHPDGSGLAYVGADRSVRWVQRSTGEEHTVLPPSENRFEISFSPSGDVMVVVESSACTAHAWPTTNRLWRHEGQFSPCKIAWHPDGQRVAIGLEGRNDVLLCHAETGRVEEYLSGHSVHPRMLQFDRDGDRLFSVAWDGLLMAWNAHTGQLELTSAAFPSVLSMSADGGRLAFGLSTTEIAVATLEPGAFFHEFAAGDSTGRTTSDLAVSPDGRWLASIDNFCLRLWDTQSARLVAQEPITATEWAAVRFTSDGTSVIQSGVGTEIVRRVVHADSATKAAHLGPPEPVAPGHPGILLFVDCDGDWWVEESQTNQLFCWPRGDARNGKAAFPIQHSERTRFSPDRRYVATTRDDDGHVVINETSTQTPIAELLVGRRAAIAFSPDRRWFVSANKEKYQLWEVGTWRAGPSWPAVVGNHATSSFFFSHDGRLLAARHSEGGLELRDTVNYEPLLRLEPPAGLRAEHMKWSPDGQNIFLLCTGHRLARWDLGAIRRELARRRLDW